MDPITAAIVGALSAGAAKGITDVAKTALVDGYNGIKGLIQRKFGESSAVAKAMDDVQTNPASEGRKAVLDEEVKAADVSSDPEIASAAKQLLELVKSLPGGDKYVVTTTGVANTVAVGGSTATATFGSSVEEMLREIMNEKTSAKTND